MFVNNQPFPETLQMAQRDMYDIDTMLLKPLKKQQKIAKRKKIAWKLVSVTEHAVGVTFGVIGAIEAYNNNYVLGILYGGLMLIGAHAGFNANKNAKPYANKEKQLKTDIKNTELAVNGALPETLHEIAEIARNTKHR